MEKVHGPPAFAVTCATSLTEASAGEAVDGLRPRLLSTVIWERWFECWAVRARDPGRLLPALPLPFLPDLIFKLVHFEPVLEWYLKEQADDLVIGHGYEAELVAESSGAAAGATDQNIIFFETAGEAPARQGIHACATHMLLILYKTVTIFFGVLLPPHPTP